MTSASTITSPAGHDARVQRGARVAARTVEAGLVLVLAWLAAQALWFALYGAQSRELDINPGLSTRAGAAIERDLSALQGFAVFASRGQARSADSGDAPETRLNLVLRGVRTGPSPLDGSAVIESPGLGQRALAAGAEIAQGVRLVEIHPDRVLINRRGARETIYLREEGRRAARAAAPRPAAQAAARETASPLLGEPDAALAASMDVEDWVDGLRLEPAMADGAMTGLRVRDTTRLEVLRASGLTPGDVIVSVNGTRLTGAQAAGAVTRTFETAGEARLEIEREGAPVTLTIPLAQGD